MIMKVAEDMEDPQYLFRGEFLEYVFSESFFLAALCNCHADLS